MNCEFYSTIVCAIGEYKQPELYVMCKKCYYVQLRNTIGITQNVIFIKLAAAATAYKTCTITSVPTIIC